MIFVCVVLVLASQNVVP